MGRRVSIASNCVIPAKAGIQSFAASLLVACRIPAFARMTIRAQKTWLTSELPNEYGR